MPHQAQVQQLRNTVLCFADSSGVQLVKNIETGMVPFLQWLQFLNSFKRTGIADELLDAVGSTIRETAGYIALGLVRPVLFSMRTQIDLVLAWLYFKDHSIEWRVVNATGDGFKLKKELLEYLSNTVSGFGKRYGILKITSTRQEPDTYRLLSAHIHGQSNPVLPVMNILSDIVRTEAICSETAILMRELSEYVGDILFAIYAPEFLSLPVSLVKNVDARFVSEKQRKEFYESL